jgi:pantoate--beta-alanine ligase
MQLVQSIADLQGELNELRRRKIVGLVPTMGNLHDGHTALVDAAAEQCDVLVASVYVNPLQFGASEDLASYPRTPVEDQAILEALGVDLLFAPEDAEMYPQRRDRQVVISIPGLCNDLCGAQRPGHFEGVATVVTKLFNIVRPDKAYFGEKDFQQLLLIKEISSQLDLDVDVIGVGTVRHDDGLALSSRNRYLSVDERERAPILKQTLDNVAHALRQGARGFDKLEQTARLALKSAGFVTDYVSVRNSHILAPPVADDTSLRVLGAAQLGAARLIDNIAVELQ